ncbi:MAG: glycosyltransferase family 2 protein [Actinobacteria bacterium]|nr:glycosyltransferase family 2 protein [Actinomycetota bacterium]MBU2687821.1 glycosyltransferase family 2 protein [Actinomycetota bacterium]
MKPVSVVLINFNGLGDLPACLQSLEEQDYPDIELILIDNASSDGSPAVLREFASRPGARARFAGDTPTLIANEANIGFSPALNQGIKASSGSYVMPLNTDVVMDPGFISAMVRAASGEGVGSVSGKLLRFPPHERGNIIDSAGHVIFRNRLAENRGEGSPGDVACLDRAEVFGTCGAAALYSREMLDDVAVDGEYFDEDFFAFWEDLDLDWRARLRGWRCVYEPAALAWHARGGAGYRKSLLVERHNYKNRWLTVMKNDSARYLLRNLPGVTFTELMKAGALLLRCPAALPAAVDLLRLAPRMLAKRRVIQSRRLVPARELERWFEPFDYGRWVRRHALNRGEMIVEGERDRR